MEATTNWELVKLKDLCERITKGSTPTSYGYQYTTEGIRFIKAENIDSDGIASSTTNYIDSDTHQFLKRSILKDRDILFSIAGTIGRVGLLRPLDLPANTNQALAIVRLKEGALDHKYLFHYLRSDAIQKTALKQIVGVGRANLSLENIGDFEIPVAPLDQQKRIVAEIEKQFSRLDEAVANLKRVKANLKRYKAAVLKTAVEGRLVETEAEIARREGRSYETGEQLLQRILETRRSQGQGKGKYKEPVAPDTADLPELPEGWVWASVGQLGAVKGGKRLPAGHTYAEGRTSYPYIRVTDFEGHGVRTSELQYLKEETQKEIARYTITSDDIYISIAGSIGLVGRVPEHLNGANLTENAAKITELVHDAPMYLVYWLSSPTGIVRISESTIATTQAKLALFRIELIPVPLPPLAEQHRIVSEIDHLLSVTCEAEGEFEATLKRTQVLRNSILGRAFSRQDTGPLVRI